MFFVYAAEEKHEAYILSSIIVNTNNLSYCVALGKDILKGMNCTRPSSHTLSNNINFTINKVHEDNIDVTLFGKRKKIILGQDLLL